VRPNYSNDKLFMEYSFTLASDFSCGKDFTSCIWLSYQFLVSKPILPLPNLPCWRWRLLFSWLEGTSRSWSRSLKVTWFPETGAEGAHKFRTSLPRVKFQMLKTMKSPWHQDCCCSSSLGVQRDLHRSSLVLGTGHCNRMWNWATPPKCKTLLTTIQIWWFIFSIQRQITATWGVVIRKGCLSMFTSWCSMNSLSRFVKYGYLPNVI